MNSVELKTLWLFGWRRKDIEVVVAERMYVDGGRNGNGIHLADRHQSTTTETEPLKQ